jgi:hypothetical protein
MHRLGAGLANTRRESTMDVNEAVSGRARRVNTPHK